MTQASAQIAIGAPAYHPAYGKIGHVCQVEESAGNTYALFGTSGTMQRARHELVIVWEDDLSIAKVSDATAGLWLQKAQEMGLPVINSAPERLQEAEAKQAERYREQSDARERGKIERAAFEAEAASKIPAWAKAIIVAEKIEDQSDIMTDYHGSTVRRSIILGFSSHTRDLFPEMRKAARNHPETASLADAPDDAEHREKWSMGGGYYLKAGFRHSSGWRVSKKRIGGEHAPVKYLPTAEFALGEPEAAPAAKPAGADAAAAGVSGIRIEEHTHTKKGFQMFLCILPDRVERDEFNRLRDLAQAIGGWYSRPWGKTPGGFAFKDRAAAESFANPGESDTPDDDGPKGGKPAAIPTPAPAMGDKLRGLADAMQGEIDSKFADRLANTPKRQRQAASARNDGYRLQRTQQALRALAVLHDAGNVPPELRAVTSKKTAFDLMRSVIESSGGYYDAGHDTGRPALDTPAAVALWRLIDGRSDSDLKADELRRKVESLRFANIPGYFPTPRAVVEQMLDLADIAAPVSILEPSAGDGAICDAIRETVPQASITAYERHCTLQEVLQLKGYSLGGSDFMEAEAGPRFDRVMMNPPFEAGQDMEHVRHAFDMLKDGGRLVAVMSPGPFFRGDRKAQEFRAWFDDLAGEKYDLPAGSFKASGTGVGAVLVVLRN